MLGSWLDEFNELSEDVESSNYQMFAVNVQRWLDFIDSHALVALHLAAWERRANFPAWYAALDPESGDLKWPSNSLERLGIHLGLLRTVGSGELRVYNFTLSFFYTQGDFNLQVHQFVQHVFRPFRRELSRTLQKIDLFEPPAVDEADIPASDRVVTLDHNSAPYRELIDALERLETAIARVNDYPAPEMQERQATEIAAGKRLLSAHRVRLSAVWAVLRVSLQWLIKQFAEKEIGHLADHAWTLLLKLFE